MYTHSHTSLFLRCIVCLKSDNTSQSQLTPSQSQTKPSYFQKIVNNWTLGMSTELQSSFTNSIIHIYVRLKLLFIAIIGLLGIKEEKLRDNFVLGVQSKHKRIGSAESIVMETRKITREFFFRFRNKFSQWEQLSPLGAQQPAVLALQLVQSVIAAPVCATAPSPAGSCTPSCCC